MTNPSATANYAFRIERGHDLADAAEREQATASPGFGHVMTEHMVSARWTAEAGWHDLCVIPYQDIKVAPSVIGLHYGQVIFEGLKAYRLTDGGTGIFRPLAHARRFQNSAKRIVMPEMDENLFVECMVELVRADHAWIPSAPHCSLYLRPIMFGADADLALQPARSYQFLAMAFVTEGFFNNDVRPIPVWITTQYGRAAAGGTGSAKVPGNYAGGFAAQDEAREHGCAQVVWLDCAERRWVEEMGGMNLFFVWRSGSSVRLTTPPLTGTILPGVTRDTLLTLIPELGYPVEETPISAEEWRRRCVTGEIREVFACGTAAGVTPVGEVHSDAGHWTIGAGTAGPVTRAVARSLSLAQHGELPRHRAWLHLIP